MDPVSPKNRRVLVIDDSKAIHQDFRKILHPDVTDRTEVADLEEALFGSTSKPKILVHLEVDSAHQGREGLEMVRKATQEERPYAMAFVDMRMPPGWDGLETIERIWQESPDIQIVICTAYSDHSWEETVERLGKSEDLLILKKPFDNIEVKQLAHGLTEKWNLIADRNRFQKELLARYEALRRSEAMREDLISVATEELRVPLGLMKTNLEVLTAELTGKLSEVQAEILGDMFAACSGAFAIVDDILMAKMLDEGSLYLEMGAVDLEGLLRGTCAELSSRDEIGRTFKMEYATELPLIHADPGLLARVLRRVLERAATSAISEVTVSASCGDDSGWVVLDIEPDTPGKVDSSESPFDKSFCLAAVRALGGELSHPYGNGAFRMVLELNKETSRLAQAV